MLVHMVFGRSSRERGVEKEWRKGWLPPGAVPSLSRRAEPSQGSRCGFLGAAVGAQMPAGYLCTWSSLKASGREEWKRSGGRAGSLGERCLPSLGVSSPYKEIVVDPVAHRCGCDPRWKLVGRHECRGELCLRSSEARPHVRVSDATTCAIPQLCAEAPSTVLWLP